MAFPFMPMTDEMLKKLSQIIQESDQIINSPDSPTVLASQKSKSAPEISSSHLETDQPNHHTKIHN